MLKTVKIFGFALMALFVFYGFGSSADAGQGPSRNFPDTADTCTHSGNYACSGRPLYLAVGQGEHTSGNTVAEIYSYAGGTVSIRIDNAGMCYNRPPGSPERAPDLGSPFSTIYQVLPKVNSSTTAPAVPLRTPASNSATSYWIGASCANPTISFEAEAQTTYEFRASEWDASGTAENLYRLVMTGGSARFGSGTAAGGGTSFSNRDLDPYWEMDYTMYFATTCNYNSAARVWVYDDDYDLYQSTGSYPDLSWYLSSRVRGAGGGWTLIDSGISDGGSGVDYWGGRLSANREYRLSFLNLSRPNALEVNLPNNVTQRDVGISCSSSYSCDISVPAITAGANYTDVTVRLTNESGTTWYTGGSNSSRNWIMGVVDRSASYALVNDGRTRLPPRGIGPPDNRSDNFTANDGNGGNTEYYRETGSGWSVGRYGMSTSVPNNGTRTFTVRVAVPSTPGATEGYAIRILDRYNRLGTLYNWLDHVNSCNFNVQAPNPVPDADCAMGSNRIRFEDNTVASVSGVNYAEPETTIRLLVVMRNNGETTWGPGHYLMSTNNTWRNGSPNPNDVGASPDDVANGESTPPGGERRFEFNVETPNYRDGFYQYTITYRMATRQSTLSSAVFGQSCSVSIRIAERYNVSRPVPTAAPGTFNVGEDTPVNIPIRATNNADGDSRRSPYSGNPDGRSYDIEYRAILNGSAITSVPLTNDYNNLVAGRGSYNTNVITTIPASLSANVGDTLCIQARRGHWAGWEGAITTSSPRFDSWVSLNCLTAAERPYFVVQDNGIWAGGGFDTSDSGYGSSSCPVPGGQNAGFISGALNAGEDLGTYASYLAGATGPITDLRTEVGDRPGSEEWIAANTPGLGSYSSDGLCIVDLMEYLTVDPALSGQVDEIAGGSVNPGSLTSGRQYVRNGNLTINGANLGSGDKVTIIATGNITINGPITVSGSYSNPANIPSIVIVAGGNINIDSNVTNLYGLYYAKGQIDTCGNGPGRLDANDCENQLTINGRFVANDIQFRRTNGGVNGSNGPADPAEIFVNDGLFDLSKPVLVSEFESELLLDSLRDLPPVVTD